MTKLLMAIPYLCVVTAANLLVNHYGPSWSPYIAFFLVAAALIFRDQFADLVGPRRILAQAVLIGAGAGLTFLLNQNAVQIAKASVIAFAASESVEGTLYYMMRKRPWMERAPLSACAGAAVDSVLFISIAFGFSLPIAFAQWTAKCWGGWLWARVIKRFKERDAVLPRDAQTELA